MEAIIKDKMKEIINRNGIKSFGCSQHDLSIFTHDEVQLLYQYGFISAITKNTEYLNRGL